MITIRRRRQTLSSQEGFLSVLWSALALAYVAVSWLEDRLEKRRSRRLLQELSDYQLKDIGISRADAFREGRRPFWD